MNDDPSAKRSRKAREPAGRAAKPGTGIASRPPGEKGKVPEAGGRKGPDPTRYGDWEKNGRCIDF